MAENIKYLHHKEKFELEPGGFLSELTIGYHTYGELNEAKDNVLWVCHALTADSNPEDWWPGVIGDKCCFDPRDYFIVCANILGSCYGTTGALNINPATGKPYYQHFPAFTIRDIVRGHELLRVHLGIEKIKVCLGGSCGGHQVLEYAIMQPDLIENIVTLVTASTESPWRVAVHTTQRMAIEADNTWGAEHEAAGQKGLSAARGIGLLTYRTSAAFVSQQAEEGLDKLDDFKVSSYIRYQGEKLIRRFNAYSYWQLIKCLDTHNVGRGRKSVENALGSIKSKALFISIDSDILIPPVEQEFLAMHVVNATHMTIKSKYGHDGFLIESEKIRKCIELFLQSEE